jgi:hypothetical protein
MMLAIVCDLIIEYIGFQSRIVGWMETKTINGLHSQLMLMGEDERKTMSDRIFYRKNEVYREAMERTNVMLKLNRDLVIIKGEK